METGATCATTESVGEQLPWFPRQEAILEVEESSEHTQSRWEWELCHADRQPALLYSNPLKLLLTCAFTNSDTTSKIEAMLHRVSLEGIVIPRPSDIRNYLLRYPDMVEAVPAVCRAAARRFGVDTQLSLELYRDPEVEDEYLTLYVREDVYDQHIMEVIECIWADYEEVLVSKSGWILVTTDFQPPR